jgi:Flp pilus assembly protein TadD
MKTGFLACLSVLAVTAAGCTTPQPQTPADMVSTTPMPAELNVADAAIAGGDPSMALSVSESVLKDNPDNVDALVHEGDAYYALGRCPASEAAYQLALTQNPKSTAAETGLGRCLIKTDPASAEAALEQAVQDDPGNADALNDLGIARDLQGNFAGAVDPYRRALLANPGDEAAEVNLGLSLALSGNGQAALQYLGPLATGPNASAKTREDYAAGLVAIGRIAEAKQVLSVDLPPDQVNAAIDGFSAVIADAQAPLPASPQQQASAPTAAQVQTASIATTPLPGDESPVPVPPTSFGPAALTATPPPPVPPITAPPPDNAPQNADAAYSGPSPIPGAISSSTGGPAPTSSNAPTPPASVRPMHHREPPALSPATTVAPMATTTPADTSDDSSGAYQVQLGALASQDDAQHQWNRISGAMPALFSDKQPTIVAATVNGHTYYRLRTGSFGSKADAAKFCGEVSAAGNACTLANF